MKKYQVIIIGAGTAGLMARREVARFTDNYLLVDRGPLGTTCARVGCMPSKSLIQIAQDVHQTQKLIKRDILQNQELNLNVPAVMSHVQSQRERFVKSVLSGMEKWKDHFLMGEAVFMDPHRLSINDEIYYADKIIIATGSSPVIPGDWEKYRSFFLTSNEIFEQDQLPERLLVIGMGIIGLELGQALSRLGVKVVATNKGRELGGLQDPEIQDELISLLNLEFPVSVEGVEFTGVSGGEITAKVDGKKYSFNKVLVAAGRKPNLSTLKLEDIGVPLNDRGLPEFNPQQMRLEKFPHIFLVGDVNNMRPILHEAADEGMIAGFNAAKEEKCFQRRTPIGITFCDPQAGFVGERYQDLMDKKVNFVTGKVSFEGQGRSIIKLNEKGKLHVYAHKETGKILGAEVLAPDGEHLLHLLAWGISLNLTVDQSLAMPFYHPTVEEGLKTALRSASRQISSDNEELFRCEDMPTR